MRCEQIRIHAEIPVPVNSEGTNFYKMECFKDLNNVVYELRAIKDACEDASGMPIIRHNDSGQAIPIGVANSVRWNENGCIEVDGILFHGGTSEEYIFSSTGDVVSMDIEAFGFGV